MTGEITITVTTTLTAADVFRIIIGFFACVVHMYQLCCTL